MPTDTMALRLTQRGSPFELVETCLEGAPFKVFPKGPQTLNDIYRKAASSPQREYLVSGVLRLSVGETLSRSSQIATILRRDFGIGVGRQVVIVMDSNPDWVVAFIAITSLGATAVAIHADLPNETMLALVRSSAADVAFCDAARAERISEIPSIRFVIVSQLCTPQSLRANWVTWADLATEAANERAEFTFSSAAFSPETTALIAFTSGSTGVPKGVMLSHRNLTTGLMNMMLGGALSAGRATAAKPIVKSAAGAPSVLMLAPLTHISGIAQLLLMLQVSGKIIFLSRWQVKDAFDLIEREKVRSLAGATPAMLLELIRSSRDDIDLSSLSNFHINGVALHSSLIAELRKAFPTGTLSTGYGLTETCGSVCTLAGAELLDRPLSAGKVLPSVELKLVGKSGSAVPDGEVGEIYVRGAMVMQGYWGAEEQTSAVLNDRWIKTGDLGRIDDEGYLYVLDRHNDVLIHRGRQISSTAIERAAMSIPSVSEATVLGAGFTSNIEAIYIAVVPWSRDNPAGTGLCEEIATSVHEQLPEVDLPFKVLLYPSFPRTPSGKIDRAALKQEMHLNPYSILPGLQIQGCFCLLTKC